ncbi:CHAT domain-containing protein [Rhodoferax sp. BLA1]|uniref:CHAT domain-containing protein n=1 Tax=Rhodoferax sp. BLA1 TaxID=2576062 RepID=UPI0015D4349A|nr:CHAT domain-containing protein [Rhodoferax sp. BLA1]
MAEQLYKIRGTLSDTRAPRFGGMAPSHRLIPGAARDGAGDQIEVAGNTVVRVELDNGFVLWSRVDDLAQEYGALPSRDAGAAWEFSRLTPRTSSAGERGLLGLAIRVLDFFGLDLAEKSARKLGQHFEQKLLGEHPPGLYQLDLSSDLTLRSLPDTSPIPSNQGPLLVFLHGTASSTAGSFGKLWEPGATEAARLRQSLAPVYGERVLALEHRSLTESPIQNALALVKRLPSGAELHLVSHSRGGLVGELLALSGCPKLDQLLTPDKVQQLFAADRSIAPQLGLSPLSDTEARARDADYNADRQHLLELVALLAQKQMRVTRFARVACPARGTTLASGRLDRWLSVLDYLVNAATGNGLFGDSLDFLLAVVKERTDPRTLPGIEAMVPGSALTRLLNGVPELATSADLSVIAGDIEPGDGLWNTLKVLANDWFYKNAHDLVVDTASMGGGLARLAPGARFRQDSGPKVNHFRYFSNEASIRWLGAALGRSDADSGGFLPLTAPPPAAPRCQAAATRSRSSPNKPRPIVVLLPGTMGSQLRVQDDTVWLDYWALLKGGLKRLAMDRPGISPVGLVDDFYGPLVEFLARSHQVELFPYDWRHSVRQAAARLASTLEPLVAQAERSGQPLRLVAHSMGGLVVRAMIADGGVGSALWQRITRLPGARFLMLGTPNLGSYEAVRWLTGFNPTQTKLTLLDITQNTDQIIGLVARYPGLLELLPFAPNDPDFADTSRWDKLRQAIRASWATAPAAALQEAATTWQLLRSAPPAPQHMVYVAGCQPSTVIDYQLSPGPSWWRPDQKRLQFIATHEGDGTVSWQSGCLPGVPTWYAEDTAHDALCAQPRAFPGYLDLLVNGQTRLLPSTPPARSRGAAGEERFVLPDTPPVDGIPTPGDISSLGWSGQALAPQAASEAALPPIEIAIRHGNLAYARHPVLVGHYQGDTVVSAEAVLDRQLGGALTRRLDLGIYPGPLGSNTVFLNDSASAKPAGAVVVGLGQVGALSPGLLEDSVRAALLDFALDVAHWPDPRFGEGGRPRSAAVTCLLVGTGSGGLPVADALEAILRAAVCANRRLADQGLDNRVLIDRLEFLELFEDIAIAATDALGRLVDNEALAGAVRWEAKAVETGQGGHRRVRFVASPEWYQRLEITEDTGRLRFVFPTDRARAEETLATGQLALAQSFVQIASQSTGQNSEASKTLFEMLLPLRLREMALQQGNLVVLVDAQTAPYPWELLENRWATGERPPAVAAGFIRQFRTSTFRQRPVHGLSNTALVIGNPDLGGSADFADLPGAREETQQVAQQLGNNGYEVLDCVDQSSTSILEALHKNSWRILHLAGHGVHQYRRPGSAVGVEPISGMVMGADTFLTPGDIAQLRFVPELVFVNCCHLGRVDGPRPLDRLGLAANLGEELIRMGVRAVVAAGWAVDDRAGQVFAASFYQGMLSGDAFGEAVRRAREEVWTRCPDVNTWGAYQCYGDPDFRLHRDGSTTQTVWPDFGTPHELVVDLNNLSADLCAGGHTSHGSERIASRLARVPQAQAEQWLQRADVCAALGLAWGELREWQQALDWLDKALAAERGDCPMRVLEQHANFRVRLAQHSWRAARRLSPAKRELVRQQAVHNIDTAVADLQLLCQRSPSSERLNLLGSAHKRLAVLQTDASQQLAALRQMALHYQQSLLRHSDAYAFTNWLAATLLIAQRDTAPKLDTAGITAQLAQQRSALSQRLADNPNFWDAASLADLSLSQLLLQAANQPRRRAKVPAGTQAAPVLAAYRAAIGRASSPRELAALTDNLDFLLSLWSAADKPTRHLLEQLLESLT